MMQNPWESMSVDLLKGKPGLVDLSERMAALDGLLRTMLELPPTTPPKGRRAPGTILASLYWKLDRTLSEIRDQHSEMLRRTIANSHGPVGPLAWPSGLLAYADLADYTLGGLSVIHDEGTPGPPGPRPLFRQMTFPHAWSPSKYAVAVPWLRASITPTLLHELAVSAIQDLARLRQGALLTPEEVRQRQERRRARLAIFHHDYRLKDGPKSVLAALAQLKDDRVAAVGDGFANLKLIIPRVPFKRTILIRWLRPLRLLGYVAKDRTGGFRITASGFTLYRLQ